MAKAKTSAKPVRGPAPTVKTTKLDAIVIGAGFAGLYQLHCLRDRLGLNVKVLEAGAGIGGTWYWNRYPGARCDSESHSYCYTFSKELFEAWEWSERYPGQAEILRYINFVADRLDLKRDIQLDTRVTAAAFDEAQNLWAVKTADGQTFRAPYLISAVGCLSTANVPDIPGRDTFKGRALHTGEWPHEGVDFSGQRVGMIGTGSTGIQAAPVIAETAQHLTVFQRTPNYSVPARNAPLSPEFKRHVKTHHAEIRAVTQETSNGHPFRIEDRSVFDVSAEERTQIYEKAWDVGGLQFRAGFRDILLDKAANDTAAAFLKSKIKQVVKDPVTAAKLADIDHPFSAKRPPIDTGYFETYNRSNVSLVDVLADPITEITPTGLKTGTQSFDLDILVYATGFDAMTGPLLRMDIRGRGDAKLATAWAAGPETYLGLQVAGFPNLFIITGPGSPSVLVNMPVAIEQHVEWITDCIADMRSKGLKRIEPEAQSVTKWQADVQTAANATLLPTVKHSWYLGANVPGKPRVFMPYVGGMARYRQICADIAKNGYEGFVRS
jgi:cation diffusion facilitator CzcD-associated flavoprotein CzcO